MVLVFSHLFTQIKVICNHQYI